MRIERGVDWESRYGPRTGPDQLEAVDGVLSPCCTVVAPVEVVVIPAVLDAPTAVGSMRFDCLTRHQPSSRADAFLLCPIVVSRLRCLHEIAKGIHRPCEPWRASSSSSRAKSEKETVSVIKH
jgi:hypothetical protein